MKHFRKATYIQLILDNLNTHFAGSLIETFGKRKTNRLLKKIRFIYTPKHGSWLNMAEIELISWIDNVPVEELIVKKR